MTRELLNTLYVQTPEAVIRLKNDAVEVELDGENLARVPLHHLGAIYAFGLVHVTTPLMERCADDGRALVLMTDTGRFRARVSGKTSGNVLLRRDQWVAHLDSQATLGIARQVVAAKLQNTRQVLLRGWRDYQSEECHQAALYHEDALRALPTCGHIDEVRGHEGIAAQAYFVTFNSLIRVPEFALNGRTRRPPRDRMNALLSFLYSVGTGDCVAALEGVGLDPQCGFLHVLRPGRPALALDLIEEFRAIIFDRLALTLVNRKEITPAEFVTREGGSCQLTADGRKLVLIALQRRKKEEVHHPLLKEKVPIGLLPHLQARLLARALRGDIPVYPPFLA